MNMPRKLKRKMKKSPLRKQSKSETSKCKVRIQALLREIAIKRDGGCVLRYFPTTGPCGGFRKDGELILQAEHLNTRERNISYGDMRNIVCLCQRHHGYFKPQYSRLYWEIIEKVIGPERWEWLKKVEADRKSYPMGIYEWSKIEMALRQELKACK